MRCNDLDQAKVWEMLRTVSKAIRNGTYRVAPDREQWIPKTSGNGSRKLLIPTVLDRTVQRAIVQTVQPYVDPLFDENSLGYRPRKTRLHALARAEQLARGGNRWVWITEDIKDAFNQVPQRRLLEVVRQLIPNKEMLQLIERIVLTDEKRGCGKVETCRRCS